MVVFELADVGAINLCRKSKLLLRKSGLMTCLAKFMPK